MIRIRFGEIEINKREITQQGILDDEDFDLGLCLSVTPLKV